MYSKFINYFQYNSIVILSFFFFSFVVLIFDKISNGWGNRYLFSSSRGSIFNPVTYVRMFTHILGHDNWNHFVNNFIYILLIGPMIEEKYGSINLVKMILVTAIVTAIINIMFSRNRILGASGIAFMMIILSSLVNIQSGKIPLTLVLICLFYVVNEILSLFKKDKVSHLGHLVGAICGFVYGFYFL